MPKLTTLVRSEGRAPEVVAFDEAVVGFFYDAANMLGVPKSLAAIYGICFSSPEPLGFVEIEARLDLSAGSISQGLKLLREVGALKAVRLERDRREVFTPDLEMRKLIEHWLAERLQRQLKFGRGRLQAMGRAVPGGRSESAKALRERLKYLQNWHDKASSLLPFIRTVLRLS